MCSSFINTHTKNFSIYYIRFHRRDITGGVLGKYSSKMNRIYEVANNIMRFNSVKCKIPLSKDEVIPHQSTRVATLGSAGSKNVIQIYGKKSSSSMAMQPLWLSMSPQGIEENRYINNKRIRQSQGQTVGICALAAVSCLSIIYEFSAEHRRDCMVTLRCHEHQRDGAAAVALGSLVFGYKNSIANEMVGKASIRTRTSSVRDKKRSFKERVFL